MSRHRSDDEIVELLKATVTVPEPSPLFWAHAARRVREAIDREPLRRSIWLGGLVWTGGGLLAASLAAVLVLPPRPVPAPSVALPHAASVVSTPTIPDASADGDSWTVVASLGGDLDVNAAARAGWLATGETTDRAMQALDADEIDELATLLHHALEETGM